MFPPQPPGTPGQLHNRIGLTNGRAGKDPSLHLLGLLLVLLVLSEARYLVDLCKIRNNEMIVKFRERQFSQQKDHCKEALGILLDDNYCVS